MIVLVVDDSQIVRQRIVDMVSEIVGIDSVSEAGDKHEALNLAYKLRPDVLILDIQLPDGNGIDVLKEVRKRGLLPITIIVTNYPYPQYREKSLKAGAQFFFDKSSEFYRIPGVVRQLVQSHGN
ncbi:MAG TPA: response regulator [Dehalococcoidia bacterium]|nr:response regulator [Dehalococcoidia bacterium]